MRFCFDFSIKRFTRIYTLLREEEEEEMEAAGLEVVSDDMVKDFSLAALDKFYDRIKNEYEDF